MTTTRLVLADDHPIVLDGLWRLFGSEPNWRVVAACRNGEATLAAVLAHRPDLLILDLRMPGLGGLDVLRRLSEQRLAVLTVVLTADLGSDELAEAIRLGVRGVVLKDEAPHSLLECARKVLAGGRCLDRQLTGLTLERLLAREAAYQHFVRMLTAREVAIARLVARGLRNKEIGAQLAITEGTVKIHLHSVYQKLGVASRVELANRLREVGAEYKAGT